MFKIPKLSTILLSVIALFLLAIITPETNAARTSDLWQERFGTYLETSWDEGRDILINGVNKYLNFGTTSGSSGYGIRDNAGTIEYKNDSGSWAAIGSGGGGGGGTTTVYLATTTPWTAGNLAYVTGQGSVGSVATGTLTETVTGLELNATRALIGGSAILSLTSGYSIPSTTDFTNWNTAYSWGNHASQGYIATTTGNWTGTVDGNNFAGGAIGSGDLLYGSGAGSIAELGIGASSTLLVSNGSTPFWITGPSICLAITGNAGLCDGDDATGAGGGITSLNALTNSTQTFAVGTSSNVGIGIVSSGSTHTFTPTLASGFTVPSTTDFTNWNTAYASTTAMTPTYTRGLFSNTATGLTYTGATGITALTAGYNIPLSASTTEWTNFYATPSNRITAGNGLAWSGNTLSATNTHNPITLSGALDYITLVGQDIVRGAIDLATDITGTLAVGNGGTGLTSTGASSTILSTNGTNPVWVGGNTLCVAITGSADLCDGGDATGGGGGTGLSTSTAIASTEIIYGTSNSTVGSTPTFTFDSNKNINLISPNNTADTKAGINFTHSDATGTSTYRFSQDADDLFSIQRTGDTTGDGAYWTLINFLSPTIASTTADSESTLSLVTRSNATSTRVLDVYNDEYSRDNGMGFRQLYKGVTANPIRFELHDKTTNNGAFTLGEIYGTSGNYSFTSIDTEVTGVTPSVDDWVWDNGLLYFADDTKITSVTLNTPSAGITTYGINRALIGSPSAVSARGKNIKEILRLTADRQLLVRKFIASSSANVAEFGGNVQIDGSTTISSSLRLLGAFKDSINATGTAGMVLQSTGTSTIWVATSSLGISGGGGGGGGDSVLSRTAGGLIYTPTTTDSLAIGLSATTTNSRLEVNGTTTATVLVASSSIYSSSTASSTISNLIVNWFQVATDWVRGLFGSGLGRDENGDLAIVSRTDKRYNPQQITPTNHYSLDSGWSDWYLNGTTTHDATDYIDGTASMKIVTESDGSLTGMRLNITDVDMSNQTFGIWLKSDNWSNVAEANVIISTEGAFTSFYYLNAKTWLVSPANNEWIHLTFTLSDLIPSGSPDLATANDLIMRVIGVGGQTPTVWMDGFSTYDRTGASGGLVSITFDDANDSQFTTAEPYLDKYGYKGTFYIIPEEVNTGGSMTQTQVETLHNQGHEVAMHGATNLSTFSLADLQTELNEIKAYQIRYGFSDNFSYPNGAYNDQIREEVSKRFSSSRNISFLKNNPGYIDPYYINAVSMGSSTATSTLTGMIDEAIANDEWLILNFHDIVTSASAETQLNTSKYQAVIDYLNTTGVNVMPVEQVLARTYEQLSIHQFDNGTNANAGTLWHGDGTWGYQTLRPRNFVEFLDDYLAETTTAGDAVWAESIAGTGAACTQSTLTSNADLGVSSCTTGTTTTGRASLVTGVGSIAFGAGTTTHESRLRPESASNGTERYQLFAGFYDTNTVNQVDGAYFLYDEGGVTTGSTATTSWQCVTASNSTRTFTNSGIPVSVGSGMTKLTVEVNPAGNSVKFYVNQTLACTHTTNIPTGTTRVVGSGVNIVKSVGTTARTFTIDYQYMNRWFNTAR